MGVFKLFHPLTKAYVTDLSSDLVGLSYNEATYGSLDGDAQIEVTPQNEALLRSLTENSHYLKVSSADSSVAGAVIENAYIDRGICHVSIIGFLEYLAKVPLIPSNKANSIGAATTVATEDASWSTIIYADSVIGLFYEVFTMVAQTMRAHGQTPFFRMDDEIEGLIYSSGSGEWAKSYRVNGLEIPNCAEAYADLTEDEDFLPIRVSVTPGNSTFSWLLSGLTSYNVTYINTATSDVKDVEIERGDKIQRSMALASGTDPKGNNLISKIEFNENVAYSAVFAESSSKASLDILRSNRANIAGANLKLDQASFTGWNPDVPIFDAVQISGPKMETILLVITEKSIEGQDVKYTGTMVTSVDEMIPGIKKPTSPERRALFNPAKQANRRSILLDRQKQNPTGWR